MYRAVCKAGANIHLNTETTNALRILRNISAGLKKLHKSKG